MVEGRTVPVEMCECFVPVILGVLAPKMQSLEQADRPQIIDPGDGIELGHRIRCVHESKQALAGFVGETLALPSRQHRESEIGVRHVVPLQDTADAQSRTFGPIRYNVVTKTVCFE